jgi:hypothetical protein
MEMSLQPVLSNYRVLTSFREPLSHFFSACIHNAINEKEYHTGSKEPYNLQKSVTALKNGKRIPGHFDLRNFQTSYLMNSSASLEMLRVGENPKAIALAKEYVKNIYWFSLSEHITLSLALLQCQVFGSVQSDLLTDATRLPKLNDHTKSHEILNVNSMMLADIHSLIKTDIYMYELIVQEFWERIERHNNCLKNHTTDDLYNLLSKT